MVNKELEQEAREYAKQFKHGGDYRKLGYIDACCQSSTVKELEREAERLKGLLEKEIKDDWYDFEPTFQEDMWNIYKTENNL